jgi:hypothetical protein
VVSVTLPYGIITYEHNNFGELIELNFAARREITLIPKESVEQFKHELLTHERVTNKHWRKLRVVISCDRFRSLARWRSQSMTMKYNSNDEVNIYI